MPFRATYAQIAALAFLAPMMQLSRDQRRRRIERNRKELLEISADPDITAGMTTAKQELDRIAASGAKSQQDLASAVVECFRWSDHLLARGLFAVLQGAGCGGWQDVLAAAGYRLAEFNLRYRFATMQGGRAPIGHVHTYIPFCNAFLAVCCLGDESIKREFAQWVIKLGRDGVRAGGSEEASYPAFVEAVAAEILGPGTGRARMSAVDHPFARVAAHLGEGADFWKDVEEAFDLHLLLCDESPAAGARRHMNYPALGLALFAAPVLAAMKFPGIQRLTDGASVHPLMDLPTADPPQGLPLNLECDSTLMFLLRESGR